MSSNSRKYKVLLTFTGMVVCFSFIFTLVSFSWESKLTIAIPQPSRRTNGSEDNAPRTESLLQDRNRDGSQHRNISAWSSVRKIMKNSSSDMSDGSSFKRERLDNGTKQPLEYLKKFPTDHLRKVQSQRRKPVASRTSGKSLRERSSKEVATNLSLSFQAAQLRFERKMALYSQQAIEEPVSYTSENIPADLRALAPKLFFRFPREFLPEYKSPCWKVHNKTLRCLPYFFIGGFPKCATTDLWGKLMTHPALVKVSKEPHWWTRTKFEDLQIDRYIQRYDKLVREMKSQQRQDLMTCDASALTFQDNKALIARLPPNLQDNIKYVTADFIRAALPDLKIVGIMRNPTERAYSAYMYFNENDRFRKSPKDFHVEVVQAIEEFYKCADHHDLHFCAYWHITPHMNTGCYSFYIREYMARFPRDQLYFLRTEDWSKDPAHYMKEIYTFLNIDPLSEEYRQKVTLAGKLNQRKPKDRKLGPMLPQTKKLLDDFYRPCNEDLAKLLNDDGYLWHNNDT